MRLLKLAAFAALLILLICETSAAQRGRFPRGGRQGRGLQSDAQLVTLMGRQLDAFTDKWEGKAGSRLIFSGNVVLAHGSFIDHFPIAALNAYVDRLHDAGAGRIDINPSPAIWVNHRQDTIAKYDALIEHARAAGMQIAINPEYSRGEGIDNFEEMKAAAREGYAAMARQYHPDLFTVIHEPGTMSARLGVSLSPREWADFATEMAAIVKKESPATKVSAGVLHNERQYFNEFLRIQDIDNIGFDIYALQAVDTAFVPMIEAARAAGKTVHIEETWRPPVEVRGGRVQVRPGQGIGHSEFAELDVKWLKALAAFASATRMEAITPFWTQTFFRYGSDDRGGLSPDYNEAVAEAVQRRESTSTYDTYKQMIDKYGRRR